MQRAIIWQRSPPPQLQVVQTTPAETTPMRLRTGRRKANDPMRYYSQSPVSRPICVECAPPLAHAPTLRESHAHVGPRPLATALLGPTSHVWEHSPALLAIASQAFCVHRQHSSHHRLGLRWMTCCRSWLWAKAAEARAATSSHLEPRQERTRMPVQPQTLREAASRSQTRSPRRWRRRCRMTCRMCLRLSRKGAPSESTSSRAGSTCKKARFAKAAKQAQRKADQEAAKRRASDSMVRAVSTHFLGIARTLGLPPQRLVMDEERAELLMRLACMPTVKRDGALQKAQNRAAALVAQSVMVEQSVLA